MKKENPNFQHGGKLQSEANGVTYYGEIKAMAIAVAFKWPPLKSDDCSVLKILHTRATYGGLCY